MNHECPGCKSILEIKEEWEGMEICCSVCGKDFTVCATPSVPVQQVTPAPPEKRGMVISFVVCGISALISFCCTIAWMIYNRTANEFISRNDWEEYRKFVDDMETFRNVLSFIQPVNSILMNIFIFLATIFAVLYLNKSSVDPVTAKGQAALKRIKSAAFACGAVFIIGKILVVAYAVVSHYLFMLVNDHDIEFSHFDLNEFRAWGSLFSNLISSISTVACMLAIIFTVKYWVWKKSQAK